MPGARHVNGEIWNTIEPLHQLQDGNALNDYGSRRRDPPFDDAIYLIVEMNQVILCGDHEQIGLDQRHVKIPRKVATQGGFSNAVAAVNGRNYTRQAAHGRGHRIHNLGVGWENARHPWPRCANLTTAAGRRAMLPAGRPG
jgi:hypothetical protein